MSRRIEIELTSRSPEGSWTWRAAGARQPRGVVEGSLLPAEAAVGSQFRAEIEQGLDGVEVVGVLPVKGASESKAARIEVIGSPKHEPEISVTLIPGARRGRDGDRRERRDGRDGRDGRTDRGRGPTTRGDRTPRSDGPPRRDDGRPRPEGGRREGARPEGGRPEGARAEGSRPDSRPPRARPEGGRGEGGREGGRGERPGRDRPGTSPGRERRAPAASTTHRNAALASLRPEQLPVAEQLLRGGIPAVRQAITEQNTAARASGGPPAASDAILAMAEELLPLIKLAEWKDRATTAAAAGRDMRLRELRAVVAASRTVNLDDEGRTLATSLSESLERRVTALRDEWVKRIETGLADGRVLDALRASTRAPEPGTRCPAELAVALADGAGAAMTADTDTVQWQELLEAVIDSPVRRTVKPRGIPSDEIAQSAARHAAGSVPELAKLLGLRIPPPPPRRTVVRRTLTPTASDHRGGDSGS
jgi:hypothetical protein